MTLSRIPSLNWLRVFEAAARSGSFSRASEILNMSPPAVSQQIKALEGYLGRELFLRGPRSVALTEAGAAYLPTVAQALHSVEIATGNLFGEPGRQPLAIHCSAMLAAGWLIPRLHQFCQAHPEIQVSLTTEIHAEDTPRNDTDLRIGFGLPHDPSGEADTLFGERIFPVATPEVAETVRCPADLSGHTLIEISTHRANWSGFLGPDAPDPRILYTDTTLNALAMAAGRLGIALARAPASDALVAQYGLERCLDGAEINGTHSYLLTYPARSALTPAAQEFRAWLLDETALA
ncbi:MAG: LysR substrate-binding domain-containing protein [Pseudomonadota bacterium]